MIYIILLFLIISETREVDPRYSDSLTSFLESCCKGAFSLAPGGQLELCKYDDPMILDLCWRKSWHEIAGGLEERVICYNKRKKDNVDCDACCSYLCVNETRCKCDRFNVTSVPDFESFNYTVYCYNNGGRHLLGVEEEIFANKHIVTINMDTLKFEIAGVNNVTFKITKGTWSTLYTSVGTTSYLLPRVITLTSGDLSVCLLMDDGTTECQDFSLVGYTYCKLSDCVLCAQTVSNFYCQPRPIKFLLVSVIIILSVLLMMIIPSIFLVMSLLVKPFTWSWKKMRERFKSNPLPVSTVTVTIIMCLIGAIACCDQSLSITTLESSCIDQGSTRICNESINTAFTLPGIGSVVCIDLKTESGDQAARMEITYQRKTVSRPLIKEYWTSNYIIINEQIRRCRGAGSCHDNNCELVQADPEEYFDAFGELVNSEVLNHPGRTFCEYKPGGIAGGCVSIQDSCLYGRVALKPTGAQGYAYKLGTEMWESELKVVWTNNLGLNNTYNIIIGMIPLNTINFTLSVSGEFAYPPVAVPENSVVIDSVNNSYFTPISIKNSPSALTIGDIQASSQAGGLEAERDAFIFGDVWQSQPGNQYDNILGVGTGWSRMRTNAKLPFSFGGNMWRLKNNMVQANLTSGAPILLQVQSMPGFRIVRTYNVATPKINKIYDATGCCQCQNGFTIILNAESTGIEGLVSVSTITEGVLLHTSSLRLTMQPQNFTISGEAAVCDTTLYVKLKSSIKETVTSIRLLLRTLDDIEKIIGTNVTDINGEPSKKNNWFENALTFGGNWANKLVGALFYALMTGILILCILFVLYKIYKRVKPSKKEN